MCKEELPDILTAKHMATYLAISRRRVYELMQIKSEFGGLKEKTVVIGMTKRVAKVDFLDWIEQMKGGKSDAAS